MAVRVQAQGGAGACPPDDFGQEDLRRYAIEHAVVQVFGVSESELRRASRGRANVALARQVAMYLAHVGCGLSLTEAGRLFERDRTTVAHACGVIEDRRDDPLFDRALDLLEWAMPALLDRHGNDAADVARGEHVKNSFGTNPEYP
ncbi:helix-turn-helix domain-containing protein [Hyphomicrobium sp. D-2]|uniref:helix-turn-helix domain-containing protein n=1 Tax=Hyphomicrobium sp. D-2 TaxID=3041621 RepID=UPI002456079E|nr:helix-turn-helix domain-containing protein [Hyphomicrobium sp. D-2]MDH4981281.1 helix-turn-helix domain-containing protein [Hyphomicrobium sp. D-2]